MTQCIRQNISSRPVEKKKPSPTLLMILDGFGLNPSTYGNAIAQAKTPFLDALWARYPHTSLAASGEAVGLPAGQMGNSEVGHLNIGAGRVVYQDLLLITRAIADGSFFKNKALADVMRYVKEKGHALHLMGLLSDGGVHSHINHLKALLAMAEDFSLPEVYIHCFLDGRDVSPTAGASYVEEIENTCKERGIGKVATVSGRYFAMDRDNRWERIQKSYDAMVLRQGIKASDAVQAIRTSYADGITDEFFVPAAIDGGKALRDGDGVIFFNFRPDRAREMTRALVAPDFSGFERKKTLHDLHYVCMTQYDATIPHVDIAFPPEEIRGTLGEQIAALGLRQLRIAETEKYAHVTFFLNGGREEPFPLEDRILVPSPQVATYDLQPEMSAFSVTKRLLEDWANAPHDLTVLNFANADMVGHTGVPEAAVRAVEALDSCIAQIVPAVLKKGGQILLTADHGNADVMLNDAGEPVTSHSLNPVPLLHIAAHPSLLKDGGRLCDIAPTLLSLMGLPIPREMTGTVLSNGCADASAAGPRMI